MSLEREDEKTPTGLPKWIGWTGFANKTLWDWMQLLIVPIVLGAGAIWFQSQANSTAQKRESQRAEAQQNIENDRVREAAFQAYLASISTLLLDKNLSSPSEDSPIREIARANTLSTLRQLDPDRKGLLVTFLYDSGLIGFTPESRGRDQDDSGSIEETTPTSADLIIDMFKADLSGANLSEAFLEGIDLLNVNLSNANLKDAYLNHAILIDANLNGANLQGADLISADLEEANLDFADLTGANVTNQQLARASFSQGLTLPDGSQIASKEEAMVFKQQYGGIE